MLVPPNAVTDNGGSDNDGDGEQYWPDFQNPSDCGSDEESRQCEHKGKFQNLGNQVFGIHLSSRLLSKYLGTVFWHGIISRHNDV